VGCQDQKVFSWPGVNPLVGLRGTALEIEAFDEQFGGNQLVLDFLFDSVIEAHQNTKNQAWFYVFVRSIRELETLDKIIEYKAQQKGKLPKEIGIMIEVPSAALDVPQLAKNSRRWGGNTRNMEWSTHFSLSGQMIIRILQAWATAKTLA